MKALYECSKSRIMLSIVTPYDKRKLNLVWWWWLNYNYYLGYMMPIHHWFHIPFHKETNHRPTFRMLQLWPIPCDLMWRLEEVYEWVIIQCGATKKKYSAKVSSIVGVILSLGMCFLIILEGCKFEFVWNKEISITWCR